MAKIRLSFRNATKTVQDGMITWVLNSMPDLNSHLIRRLFHIGPERLTRVKDNRPAWNAQKTHQLPLPNQAAPRQTELADKVIDAIQTEQGFPCAHRPVHEYVIGANSIAAVYEDYTHEVKKYNRLTTSQVKTLCKSTFTRRVRVRRPRLKFKKVMTDLCNRCYELDILIFSASSREDRRRLLKAKLMHLKQALHQRILMNAIIRTACKTLGLPGQSSAKLLLLRIGKR